MMTQEMNWKKNWSVTAMSVCVVLMLPLMIDAKPHEAKAPPEKEYTVTKPVDETADLKQSAFPQIVQTVPEIGAKDVDPNLEEIRVTFDCKMQDGMSWCGSGENFPGDPNGKAHWEEDGKTCVLPVKLKEGHFYITTLNTSKYNNFKSQDGKVFQGATFHFITKGADEETLAKTRVPQIVKLSPENEASGLDPAVVKELRATFDVPMSQGMSWCQPKPELFPKLGNVSLTKWVDDHTCVLRVELEENKEYLISLNMPLYNNFASVDGIPLEPLEYRFQTGKSSVPLPKKEKSSGDIDPKQIPKTVSLFPKNEAKNVDPNITQVYVTFDIPMNGGRAWAQRSDQTALDSDKELEMFWTADMKTCVAPVRLMPNKTYEVLMNVQPFIGFRSAAGVPSKQLLYTFRTGKGPVTDEARAKFTEKNLTENDNSPEGSVPTPKSSDESSKDSQYVNAELTQKAREALKTMGERGKSWIFSECDETKTWSYHFKCTPSDESAETREMDVIIEEKGNFEQMRGTTYSSVLWGLAALARDDEAIRFKTVDVGENEIKLHYVLDEPLQFSCGNGMKGSWYGYFNGASKEGQLTLDQKTLMPKMLLFGKGMAERYGSYSKIGENQYAPKRIQVKNGDMLFDLKFSIYEPGLWLLESSHYVFEQKDEKNASTIEISDVKVNGEPAMEMVK